MKGIYEKQLFFSGVRQRRGKKEKLTRENREKEGRKKERKKRYSIRTFTPPFQNVRTCQKDFAISKEPVTITTCRRSVPLIDNRFNLG
jgi:hypothetical protein